MPERTHNGRTQLGQRVREVRKNQGRTLQELGMAAGLSKSTLSKIENGSLSVSYDNLLKLAEALSIDVATLFAPKVEKISRQSNGRRSVTRKGAGEIYDTSQYRYEMLCTDLNPRKIFPIVATLRAHSISSARELIRHPGEEFAYVLEGRVEVHCEFYSPITLESGDGLYFDSTMGHALISSGEKDAKVLWIATSALTPSYTRQAKSHRLKRELKRSGK